jgi:LacI family transcriptional regulator
LHIRFCLPQPASGITLPCLIPPEATALAFFMSSVNLKELAKQLGLASSTVSRALRDSPEISTDTKQRVQAMATQLKYQPHAYASGLRNQMSHTIGIVVPEVNDHFFSLAIDGIEEIARQNGYHVLICLTHDSYDLEAAVTSQLTRGRVDGVLISLAGETQGPAHLEYLCSRGLPVVFFDRVSEALSTATVTTNDFDAAYQATEHLLDAGCRHIAYLLMSGNLAIGNQRRQGYEAALQAHGLPLDPDLVLEGGRSNDESTTRIKELLVQRPDIDGLFASTGRLALSAYQACQELGRAIPQDVKVIGFSNLETASLLAPPLSTVTQPAYDIGREAARILFEAIIQKQPLVASQSVELPAKLIARASTAATR